MKRVSAHQRAGWLLSEQREAEYSAIRHPIGERTIAMVRRQTLQATTGGSVDLPVWSRRSRCAFRRFIGLRRGS